VAEKGLHVLIEAFSGIPQEDARLLIGGDFSSVAGGSVLPDLKRALQMDDRIRLLGFVPDNRVPDFLASLDLFVLPSVNALEAYGIVQLEAMTAGVNVIASDLPGVRVPVQHYGHGSLVLPGDSRALREAMLRADRSERVDLEDLNAQLRAEDPIDLYEEVFISVIRSAPYPRRKDPEPSP
jgi:glycosyltransferase involved in cell wall biosynthesis